MVTESLGDCSFLNTCFHMDTCKYVHYEIDFSTVNTQPKITTISKKNVEGQTSLFPAQVTLTVNRKIWVAAELFVSIFHSFEAGIANAISGFK